MKKFVVTPWEVKGEVDYGRLVKEFGLSHLDEKNLKELENQAGELHYFLRRKIFFAHRDMDLLLREVRKGKKFFLYTGRGPSGKTHLGHLVPWLFTKWLQDKFKAKLYFQMTDDEKFLFKPELSLKDTHELALENALDVIAVGFDEKRTEIIIDTDKIDKLYRISLEVAKKITFSTAKAVFGFNNESNIGSIFFTSVQSAPCFLENNYCLVPLAVDQDPHFRVTRDVAPRIGKKKPAVIHSCFLPGLKGPGTKMSSSDPDSCIFTDDSKKEVERKIDKAFTGGRESAELQKKLGGTPNICTVFMHHFVFNPDDNEVADIEFKCKSGERLCGECKNILKKNLWGFLDEFQEKRKKSKSKLKKFLM